MSGAATGHVPRRGDNTIAGNYPVSMEMGWHGGMHLVAPNGADGHALPVRAIADGTVVFVRQPTQANDKHDDPLNYGAPEGARCWTSDGIIVIRHDTEIGANAQDQPVSVTFYSVYMHLDAIRGTVAPHRQIYRKDEIGEAGFIYGQPHRIHFEVFCDDANLQRLVGRTTGDLPLDRDGRSDVVFGELYFHLPAGTPVYGEKPLPNNPVAHRQPPAPRRGAQLPPITPLQPTHTTNLAFVIGLRYAHGEGADGHRGDATVTTYRIDGSTEGAALTEPDSEYNLYRDATEIANAYPAATRPAPSAVLELLRFGRVINTAHESLTPPNVPHWRQIRYPGGSGWVNLNGTTVHKFSDADFPHWKQWRLIDDSADQDSRCDPATILAWFDSNQNGHVDANEATAGFATATIRAKLEHTICKFPTEWSAATLDARWAWLKMSTEENPTPLTDEYFAKFKAHASALCFWDGVAGLPPAPWRFHPTRFIETFRRCGWLSENNLRRIYPNTPAEVRSRYRNALNQVLGRYGLNVPLRASHFFGQGLVETMGLRLMVEGSVLFARNPDHPSFQSEAGGYYQNPLDLYGYFHNYERTGNDLGNVAKSELWDRQGNLLLVVIGRDATGRPTVTSPSVQQIDPVRSHVGDGMKFRGRGFKQLTGLSNYAAYWVFRGWLRSGLDFDEAWWLPPRRATDPVRRPAPINDPQRLSTSPFNCIDSGGQFASLNGIPRQADGGIARVNSDNVSRIVNRWDEPSFPRRFSGATNAYEILGP